MKKRSDDSKELFYRWKEKTEKAEAGAQRETDPDRLKLHLMPPVGWLNDPNGLCQFHGIYHVFFQYSPESPSGDGLKAWGHYTSKDFLCWNQEETLFFPDEAFDKDGVYSGSACISEGKMNLYYTGNVKEEGIHDYICSGRGANTVLIQSGDGREFSEKQLLMTSADYPDTYTCHIRDPKVWVRDDQFYMVQGGRKYGEDREDRTLDQGAVLLFQGKDEKNFRFVKEITTETPFGYMWECPDYFELGETKILSFSPQGLDEETYRFQNVYQSGYLLLEKEPETWETYEKVGGSAFQEWDMGFDFYAPQTFETEDGRRILIGWAGIPDAAYDNEPTVQNGWQHALTLPRELSAKNGKIYQNPIRELQQLRDTECRIDTGETCLLENEVFELTVCGKDTQENVSVQLTDGKESVTLEYRQDEGVLSLALSDACGRGRTVRRMKLEQFRNVQIFADTSMIEIYINDGEAVMTSRFYMDHTQRAVKVCGTAENMLWYLKGLKVDFRK